MQEALCKVTSGEMSFSQICRAYSISHQFSYGKNF